MVVNVRKSGFFALSFASFGSIVAGWRRLALAASVLAVAAAGTGNWVGCAPAGVPPAGSAEYRETVRIFYRGLASLEVGLLSDARDQFLRASELAPREPAVHGNLAIAQVGVGDDEGAAAALETAYSLAPDSGEIAFLQGQLASFSGRFEDAVAQYQRAAALDADHTRTRFALAQELERGGAETDLPEARRWLEDVLDRRPDNLAVLLERVRWAARTGDADVVGDTIDRLTRLGDAWPELAVTQLDGLTEAAAGGDLARAATMAQLLRNVLVRTPAFREDLAVVSVSAEQIAAPLARFLRMATPPATAAAPDETLAYVAEPIAALGAGGADAAALALVHGGEDAAPVIVATDGETVRRTDAAGSEPGFAFPGGASGARPAAEALLPLDWNGDYRMDLALVGAGGFRLLARAEDGGFEEMTPGPVDDTMAGSLAGYGAWAADIEMDGDLDIVLGPVSAAPWVLRNNADGTWRAVRPFPEIVGLRGFAWGDLDVDGDPDAVLLDADGNVHPLENLQAGRFGAWPAWESASRLVGLALGDLNADGTLDVVTLDAAGEVWRTSWNDGTWNRERIAEWPAVPADAAPGSRRLLPADLDNNGALDLLGSGPQGTRVWLADERSVLRGDALDAPITAEVYGIADLDADGWLDLVGVEDGVAVRLRGQGSAGYGWQQIRPRAHVAAGDQRINAFGVGGEIEVRAGLLVQKQVLSGAPVHFGLGEQPRIDVARVAWPNGVVQADFELAAREVFVAEQRLKGSCPWLFAYDGSGLRFVTDVLWRSPLGMRINAQDTAGVTQTEDRVLIRGDQLAPRDGQYDLRITAELWETHFFDHASLVVVDHPEDTEVFVDERFARDPAPLDPIVTGRSQPIAGAWDDAGRDVSELVRKRDERYVATFERGTHQGITRDHFLEIDLGPDVDAHPALRLLAYGWLYPTDSSINVALGQSSLPAPRGVAVEALDGKGRWTVMHADLGFPAGKLKTMVIPVERLADGRYPRRLRLRTNLEIYWDRITWAPLRDDARLDTVRLAPVVADLRYRGYNVTEYVGPRRLELPRYELASLRPRWRDLVGYHTRFGDVRELLADVEDRYVIMNAGDELRLRFEAPPAPPEGWRRDYVLIADGWVKDGDFNTAHSKTVGPLPSHDEPNYDPDASPALEDDPVYRRYQDDWREYHTRFVAPDGFLRGLRGPNDR
ncbi:MAG: FG-GAP-like repeat-containing protein [Acidobacteria bacterium]|nr:FG-GAP-like repeat-containing protein [Acidobacteriota bacterium]